METTTKMYDLPAARIYFDAKLAFTTGPIEVDRMLKSADHDLIVVDVRAAEDYAKGHVPGSINLPAENWESPQGLDSSKLHVLYCYTQTCHLAARAAAALLPQGYKVMEMEGGFEAWKNHHLDIERESYNRLRKPVASWLHGSG